MCILPNMKVIYVSSKSEPCGKSEGNDISLFKANVHKLAQILCPGDVVLADKAFAHSSLELLASSTGFQLVTRIKIASL